MTPNSTERAQAESKTPSLGTCGAPMKEESSYSMEAYGVDPKSPLAGVLHAAFVERDAALARCGELERQLKYFGELAKKHADELEARAEAAEQSQKAELGKRLAAEERCAELAEKLKLYAVNMSYDCPGDVPIECGYFCDLCP